MEHSSPPYVTGPPPQKSHKNESQTIELAFPKSLSVHPATQRGLHVQLTLSLVTNNLRQCKVKQWIKISCILIQKSIKAKFLGKRKKTLFSKQHR